MHLQRYKTVYDFNEGKNYSLMKHCERNKIKIDKQIKNAIDLKMLIVYTEKTIYFISFEVGTTE